MSLATCLWLPRDVAAAAVDFYVGLFDDSRIVSQRHLDNGGDGDCDVWQLILDGAPVDVMGAAYGEAPTTAISLVLKVPDQATLDRYWDGILADGGTEVQCGWIRDRFGVSWQICPQAFYDACAADQAAAQRAAEAVWTMTKIDVARVEAAARGR